MSHQVFARVHTGLRSRVSGCSALHGAVLGISGATMGVTYSRCEISSSSAAPPVTATSPMMARLREKIAGCKSKKLDSKLLHVHEAERVLLDRMFPNTPYETVDVKVHVDGFGARCALIGPETELSIHTVIVGAEHADKTPIVLVHGFMMGAGSFWKLLPHLAKERTVYAIDIIGMAGSSRPPFDAGSLTPEDIEELLYEPFEQWAKALQIHDPFVLLGHSFGGLVSAYWAVNHPERIASLGLLSPCLGFSDARIDKFTSTLRGDDVPWQSRAFFALIEFSWAHHLTPQTLVRWLPGFKGWLERSTQRRYQSMASGVNEEEGRLLSEYVVATMDMPASTEAAAPALFGPFLRPIEVAAGSIKSRLAKLDGMPLFAIYGDRDWMETPAQTELPNCRFLVLPSSGHHLALDAPVALADIVLKQLKEGQRN